MRRRPRLLASALLAAALAAGCTPSIGPDPTDAPTSTAPTDAEPTTLEDATPEDATPEPTSTEDETWETFFIPPDPLEPRDVATDLAVPWGIDVFPDGDLLLSERDTGRVLRIAPDGTVTELGTLPAEGEGEGGLLGVALSPDATHVYAYYSTADDNRVVRAPLDGDALGPEEVLLEGIPVNSYHDGGQLRFGPDGFLYVTTGDAGEPDLAQDTTSLAGKILRLTPDGAPAPGNPFDNEVYTYGHRNVQGLAWDESGNLWASEFGQNEWDELNLIVAGNNYGWPEFEGYGDPEIATDPMLTWTTAEASPSGLAYWRGSLWMASLRGETLWQITVAGTVGEGGDTPAFTEPVPHWTREYGRLRAVWATDDAAPLYVGTSNHDGRGTPQDGDDRILVVE